MCSNYKPVTRADRLLRFFGVERLRDDESVDTWPLGMAPFIGLAEPGSGNRRIVDDGLFGLLPPFAKELAFGRRTYNARSETVHAKPSFRDAWRAGQRCVIPAEAVYEPRYHEDLTSERWAIHLPGGVPLAVAGVYARWRGPDGREVFTFAMLTVNADDHPFYRQFHAPGEEKRMPVFLHDHEIDDWLASSVRDAPRFLRAYTGELVGEPAALPPRAPSAGSVRTARPPRPADPPPPPDQASLF